CLAGHLPVAGIHRDIAQRDDADQAMVAVNDRQPADLLLPHLPGPSRDGWTGEPVFTLAAHRAADARRLRIAAGRRPPPRDISNGTKTACVRCQIDTAAKALLGWRHRTGYRAFRAHPAGAPVVMGECRRWISRSRPTTKRSGSSCAAGWPRTSRLRSASTVAT